MKINYELTEQERLDIYIILEHAMDSFDFSGDAYEMEKAGNRFMNYLRDLE